MSFWDTVKGQHLADVLIRFLPSMAKEQYTKDFSDKKEMEFYIKERIAQGERYVTHFCHDDGSAFLIMEK